MVITELDKVMQVPVSHFWMVALQYSSNGKKIQGGTGPIIIWKGMLMTMDL